MMRALWTAASGMTNQQTNVDTISNNLSNINTAGYKSERSEFKTLLYQNLQSQSTNSDGTNKPVSAQVGLGTRLASVTSKFTQGALNETGSYMDWGIHGDGFYKVDTGTDGIKYTRNASFALSVTKKGTMVTTSEGYPVLGANDKPLTIPKGYNVSSLTVSSDGKLSAQNAKGNLVDLKLQVGLVQFSNPAGLEKDGSSLFKATDNSGTALAEGKTKGIQKSTIRQNYIESSNVSAADEMVNLIVAQRAYEMNSKCISAADTMMGQANNLRS